MKRHQTKQTTSYPIPQHPKNPRSQRKRDLRWSTCLGLSPLFSFILTTPFQTLKLCRKASPHPDICSPGAANHRTLKSPQTQEFVVGKETVTPWVLGALRHLLWIPA
jgi:hypothetical protein